MRITRTSPSIVRLLVSIGLILSLFHAAQIQAFSGDTIAEFGTAGEAISPAPGQKLLIGTAFLYVVGTDPILQDSAWVSVFQKDGSPHTDFAGDGTVTVSGPGVEWFSDVAEMEYWPESSMRRILVVGKEETGGDTSMLAVSYTHAGSLDSSFGGGDGIARYDFPGGPDAANAIISRIETSVEQMAGYIGGQCGGKPCVIKLTRTGELDPSFGDVDPESGARTGYRILGSAGTVKSLVFARNSTDIFAVGEGTQISVWRMTSAGDPAEPFGTGGCYTYSGLEISHAWAAYQESNIRRLFIAGSSYGADGEEYSLVLAITETGELDLPFGNQGVSDFRLPKQNTDTGDQPASIFVDSGLETLLSIRQTDLSAVPSGGEPVQRGFLVRLNYKGGLEPTYSRGEPWIIDPRSNFIAGNFAFDPVPSANPDPTIPGKGYWSGEFNGQAHVRLVEMPHSRDIEAISINIMTPNGCVVTPQSSPKIQCRSLRDAVDYANTDPTGKQYLIEISGRVLEVTGNGKNEDDNQTGDLDIYGHILLTGTSVSDIDGTITGPGITSGTDDRIFHVHDTGSLFLVGLDVFGSESSSAGGAIRVEPGGTLKIIDSLVRQNSVASGGGPGGAVYSEGTLFAFDSTFTENSADGGGAIYAAAGTLSNVTIAGNITRQQAGGGLATAPGAALEIQNTLVGHNTWSNAGSPLPDDCSGPLLSRGHNLIETHTDQKCPISNPLNEILGLDPLLGQLDYYGYASRTRTMNLLPGSPALDAGLCTNTRLIDQRRSYRPLDGNADGIPKCDIGAFEFNPPPVHNWPATYHIPEDAVFYGIDLGLSDPYDRVLARPNIHFGVGGLLYGTGREYSSNQYTYPGEFGFYYFPKPELSATEQISVQIIDSSDSFNQQLELIIDPVNDPPRANAQGTYRVSDTSESPELWLDGYPFHELTHSYEGTPVPSPTSTGEADSGYTTIDLPFPFPFFGQTYTRAYISNNGYLTFSEDETARAEDPRLAIVPVNQNLYNAWSQTQIYYKYFPGAQPDQDHWVVTFEQLALSMPPPGRAYLPYPGVTTYIATWDVNYSFDIAIYRDGSVVIGYWPVRGPIGEVGLHGPLAGQDVHFKRGYLAGPTDVGVLYRPESYQITAGETLEIQASAILARSYDVEGQAFSLDTTQPMVSEQGVVIQVTPEGDLLYQPGRHVSGLDSFPYTLKEDGAGGLSSSGRVFIQVTGLPNTPPSAVDDALTVEEDGQGSFTAAHLLSNDSDPDEDNLAVASVAALSAQGGSVTGANGTYTYTPPADFHGTDSIGYTIHDGRQGTSQAEIQVSVSETVDLQAAVERTQAGPVPLGEALTLTLRVVNHDPDPASQVQVRSEWSAGLGVTLPAGCQADGATAFTCALGDLAANQTRTLTVLAQASAGAPGQVLAFQFTVTGAKKESHPANNQAVVELTLASSPSGSTVFLPMLIR